MLCTLLNSHPQILCHHELFNPGGIYYALNFRDGSFRLGTLEERRRDPLAFLRRVWEGCPGYAWVGFKLTHRQEETVFRAVLGDRDVKKIVLVRNNRIKTFVSRLVSEATGVWEAYRDADLPGQRPKVRVDLSALRDHIAFDDRYYAEIEGSLRRSGQSWCGVGYEELFSDACRLRLLRYLGVPAEGPADVAGLRVGSVKQNPSDLRELIANFAELEAAVRGTDLEAELYSPRD
jgi:hypothetical protein